MIWSRPFTRMALECCGSAPSVAGSIALKKRMAGGFTSYNTKSGLPADEVFQILEDSRDNLWMSSNAGIFRVGADTH